MQQAQVNLLADMGAQPTTLMPGLVAAIKSTDTVGPDGGDHLACRRVVPTERFQGHGHRYGERHRRRRRGGHRVLHRRRHHLAPRDRDLVVVVHLRAARDRHPAGPVRGSDDSANLGAVVSRSVTVACPCSVFGAQDFPTTHTSQTGPATSSDTDASAYELGLRFSPTTDGFVTGVRFYKGATNTGTHVGTLWSSSGQKLASATFANETGTGWQSVSFAAPVAVSAGTTYVVSYTDPKGGYSSQPNAFSSAGVAADPLRVDGGFGAAPAGVYGTAGSFPNLSFNNTNYFVDATFSQTDSSPLVATSQWPLPGSSSVALTTTVSASYSKPLTAGTQGVTAQGRQRGRGVGHHDVQRLDEDGDVHAQPARSTASSPTPPRWPAPTRRATASAPGRAGPFTTAKPPSTPGVCPCTLFDDTTVPGVMDSGET